MMNQSEKIAVFENFINRVMETGNGVGMAVSIINADGAVLYEKCFGYRDQANALPMDGDTLMGIASVSKSFTALAVMQLYERGLLDIEAPVCTYIPEFRHEKVLIRHLLSHIGGFYPMQRKPVADVMQAVGLPAGEEPYRSVAVAQAGLQQLLADFAAQTEMTGRPGENFSYSNDSFALLSELVRLRGGEPTFSEYVQKHILDPLGMTSSGVRLRWNGDHISKIYQFRENGMADDWTMLDDQGSHAGAGGVKSTLNDMKKYALMYLNEGKIPGRERVLSSYGIREMIRPRVRCELNSYYGYGLVSKAIHAMTTYGHGGDQPGVAAHLDWSYESGVAVVVLCNTAKVAVEAISDLAMRLASGYEAEPPQAGLTPVEWSDEQLDALCGTYCTSEGNRVILQRNGKMFTVDVDGAQTVAYPVNRHTLRLCQLIEDMLVEIYRDDDGKVYALGGGFRMIPKVN